MNITMVIDELDIGGAQRVVYEIARNLDNEKYRTTIICMDGKVDSLLERQMLKEQEQGKYKIVFLRKSLLSCINIPIKLLDRIVKRLLRFFLDLLILPSLFKELKKSQPDIIHVHQRGILAGFWKQSSKKPMLATIHTDPSATFFREWEKIISRRLVRQKRIVMVGISQFNREIIRKHWNLGDTNARYINNGINLHEFHKKPHETFTFINVSRQDKNKNQSLIVRAFARLRRENQSIPIKLILVGNGDLHQALREEAKNLETENCVEFTDGFVENANDYLAVSDVYISSSYREGLSLSALEAMASELPIIATDAGGIRDLARDNGILIPVNDEDALLNAMKKIMDDSELRQRMGKISLEMVQGYSASEMAANYADLYQELVNQQSQ